MPTDAARELEVVRARERDAQQQISLLEARLLEAETAGAQAVADLAETRAELRAAAAELERVGAENAELRRVNRELQATADHFRTVNDGLMSSVSWRVTKPLRAIRPGS